MGTQVLQMPDNKSVAVRVGQISHVTEACGGCMVHMRNGESYHTIEPFDKVAGLMAEEDAKVDGVRSVASSMMTMFAEMTTAAAAAQAARPAGAPTGDDPVARAIRESEEAAKERTAAPGRKVEAKPVNPAGRATRRSGARAAS